MATKSKLEKMAEEAAIPPYTSVEGLLAAEVHVDASISPSQTNVVYSFDEAIKRRIEIKGMQDKLAAEYKALNDELLLLMLAENQKKVALWDGMTFEVRQGRGASKIEATILLEKGVPLETIQEATVEGVAYQYVQVNVPKTKKTE